MNIQAKDKFWWSVVSSLVTIFAVDTSTALEVVVERKNRVLRADSDIFYHSEPYDVAEVLAAQLGQDTTVKSWEDYLQLADRIARLSSVPPFDTDLDEQELSKEVRKFIASIKGKPGARKRGVRVKG